MASISNSSVCNLKPKISMIPLPSKGIKLENKSINIPFQNNLVSGSIIVIISIYIISISVNVSITISSMSSV